MTDPLDPIVKIEHVRKALMCSRGARAWAQRHGFNYMHFLVIGYPASAVEATGDALGIKVAALARADAAAGDAA